MRFRIRIGQQRKRAGLAWAMTMRARAIKNGGNVVVERKPRLRGGALCCGSFLGWRLIADGDGEQRDASQRQKSSNEFLGQKRHSRSEM
jgi:hypothetical protein